MADPLAPHLPTSISPHPLLTADPRGQASAASQSPSSPGAGGRRGHGVGAGASRRAAASAVCPGPGLPPRAAELCQVGAAWVAARCLLLEPHCLCASIPGLQRSEGRDEFSPSYQPPQAELITRDLTNSTSLGQVYIRSIF